MAPALLATLLFTTTPPVLAHAGLVTTDMALTAFVVATLLASLYWAEDPNWRRSVFFGALLGLALISKFSSLAFLPVAWLLMYLTYLLRHRLGIRVALRDAAGTSCSVGRDDRAHKRIGNLGRVTALMYASRKLPERHAARAGRHFFTGIRYVYMRNKEGQLAYLLGGHLSREQAFGYYYPVVLAVKTPLASLILMTVAFWSAIKRR